MTIILDLSLHFWGRVFATALGALACLVLAYQRYHADDYLPVCVLLGAHYVLAYRVAMMLFGW